MPTANGLRDTGCSTGVIPDGPPLASSSLNKTNLTQPKFEASASSSSSYLDAITDIILWSVCPCRGGNYYAAKSTCLSGTAYEYYACWQCPPIASSKVEEASPRASVMLSAASSPPLDIRESFNAEADSGAVESTTHQDSSPLLGLPLPSGARHLLD